MSKGIVANSVLNAAAGMTLLVVGFACSIVTARLLGPEANGIIAFSLWMGVTIALVAELGTGITLLRLLPQLKGQGYGEADRKGFAARLLRPVAVATVALLAAYWLFYWEAERQHWASNTPGVVLITGILVFVQSIGSFSKNYLIGEQRVDTFFKMASAAGLLQIVGVVGGAVFYGVPGAIAGYVFGFVLQFIYALGILARPTRSCGISTGYLVSSSVVLSLEYMVDSIFLNRVELFFLQQFHGVAVVGFYAAALSLANLAIQLPIQLTGSLLPYYSEKLHLQGGGRLPITVFENVVRSLAYITLPMAFGLAAIAPRLVTTIFGEAFAPSGPVLTLLALGTPAFIMSAVGTQYMFSLDLIRERLMVGIMGAVVMVAGGLAVVPFFAGEGAAIVRFAVFLLMSALMLRKLDFEGSLRPLFLTLGRVALAALICAATAFAMLEMVGGAAGLLLSIPAGALTYGLALRLVRAVPVEDRRTLEALATRLPRRLAGPAGKIIMFLVPTGAAAEHGA